ncbi:MAG TPA: helix-turn-helix domain-containing protein [bacterium]|nr:helix-turn-helix domain-containing protein [bacterium]
MGKKEPKTLGERIRRVRGDYSQIEFADMVRVKQPMISRYEAGHETPSPRILLRIAQFAGKSIEWLLTGKQAGGGRQISRDELVGQAAKALSKTSNPDAKDFNEMMKDLFKQRERMQRVLSFYKFEKR